MRKPSSPAPRHRRTPAVRRAAVRTAWPTKRPETGTRTPAPPRTRTAPRQIRPRPRRATQSAPAPLRTPRRAPHARQRAACARRTARAAQNQADTAARKSTAAVKRAATAPIPPPAAASALLWKTDTPARTDSHPATADRCRRERQSPLRPARPQRASAFVFRFLSFCPSLFLPPLSPPRGDCFLIVLRAFGARPTCTAPSAKRIGRRCGNGPAACRRP